MAKPNIVFILADDMGYGDIGAFGNPDVNTPNLDRLASDGVCLTQNYAGSAVCAPSRAALMTGRYPHRTGAIDTLEGRGLDRLRLEEITIADVLKEQGYTTGLFGKWHLGALAPEYHPNSRGFDEFAGFRGGWSDYYLWRLDRNGTFQKADGRYLTDVIGDESVDFIKRHKSEPFFMHVTFNAPHYPLQVPDEEAKPIREKGKFTEALCVLYAMNTRMDKNIGRILDTLKQCGIEENTLVVFSSDNGPCWGGQGEASTRRFNGNFNGSKGLVLEGGIRTPAIVRWPAGLPAGTVSNEMVHFVDWLPTLANITGSKIPSDRTIDGRNILPHLNGNTDTSYPPRFWQWNRYTPVVTSNAAMRDGNWKLVRPPLWETMHVSKEDLDIDNMLKYEPEKITDISRGPEPQRVVPQPPAPMLFNLKDDPFETTDLANQHPEIVKRMLNSLEEWFAEVDRERRLPSISTKESG